MPPAPAGAMSRQKTTGGPPRREMDSLLEEIKAKQKLEDAKKAQLKDAEAAAAAAASAMEQQRSPQVADIRLPAGAPPNIASGAQHQMPHLIKQLGGLPEKNKASSVFGAECRSLLLRELPASITEDTVCVLCTQYGIVCSVDIVYPKEPGEKIRGLVTMDTRENAQRAMGALHDRDVDGVPLWIEWATALPPNSAPPDVGDSSQIENRRCINVVTPEDKQKRRVIDRLAKYVSQEGHPFEQIIMERESPDGMFSFLFQHDTPDNIYYRWRTFAFAQGDNFKSWRTATTRICDVGTWWRPPLCEGPLLGKKRSTNFSSAPKKMAAVASAVEASEPARTQASLIPSTWTQTDIDDERERHRLEEKATQERQKRDRDRKGMAGGKRLSDPDWDKLEQLLRNVSNTRCSICEALVFCLDKADTAIEIAECVTESLTIVETDIHLKIARLMVVSDVLHNTASSRPAAWAYRREFERSLPDIFENMHLSLARLESKIERSRAQEKVVQLVRIWEDWGLFAPQFVRGLEASVVVGVKSLRSLRAKGDLSREPPWIEVKLAEWRRQHFSQLEKVCRTRGLRCSTAHLEVTKEYTLEENRREWLVDRIVCYELHWHEVEQAQAKAKTQDKNDRRRRSRHKHGAEDDEGGIDGLPLEAGDLDGLPMDFVDPSDVLCAMAAARVESYTLGGGSALLASDGRLGGSPLLVGQAGHVDEDLDGEPVMPPDPPTPELDDPDLLDIERPEDPASLEPTATISSERAADNELPPVTASDGSKLDHAVLRNIELEVMEMRASLEMQGLHRDAIQDICDEKRQRMIKEHEASLASPPYREDKSGGGGGSSDDSTSPSPAREPAKSFSRVPEAEKKDREKAAGKSKDKDDRTSKEKEREKARAREAERTREKEKKSRTSRSRGKKRSRSASRDRGKKKSRK